MYINIHAYIRTYMHTIYIYIYICVPSSKVRDCPRDMFPLDAWLMALGCSGKFSAVIAAPSRHCPLLKISFAHAGNVRQLEFCPG